jgi:hypothetical protein
MRRLSEEIVGITLFGGRRSPAARPGMPGHEVTSRPEVAVDHRVRRQEPLCLIDRFEPLHLSLSSPRGSMRILSPIVQIPAGPVSYIRHDRSLSNAVAAQAVRDEASWLIAKPT